VAVSLGKSVSVYEMMRTVGRAGIATRSGSAEEITNYLRSLGPEELVEEYHRAIATLLNRGLLSHQEKQEIKEYATDWVSQQPLGL